MLHHAYLDLKRRRRTRRRLYRELLPQTNPADLPRQVFLYWNQGFDAAPDPCGRCVESWQRLNPGWDVVLLDHEAAEIVLPRASLPADISHAAYSDLLRARLLAERGGVWADATLLCLKPLDMWLPQLFMQTDFFAFVRPGPDRLVSSWFLAAAPGAPLMRAWDAASTRLWQDAPTRVKPYFWFHYTLEYLLIRARAHRRAWSAVPRISADPLHRLQRCIARGGFSDADWATIDASPVQKLTYKKPDVVAGLGDALASLEDWRAARQNKPG